MKKRKVTAAVTAACLILAVSGCGSSSEDTSGSESTAASQSEAEDKENEMKAPVSDLI